MVKVIVIVLVLAAAAVVGVYYLGGISSFDPTEQGRQAKAALSPGMTWSQVVDAAGDPKHYCIVRTEVRKSAFGEKERRLPGAEREFDAATLKKDIADGTVPDGFILRYFFSHQVAFQVWFDSSGVVTFIEDVATMADLLDSRGG